MRHPVLLLVAATAACSRAPAEPLSSTSTSSSSSSSSSPPSTAGAGGASPGATTAAPAGPADGGAPARRELSLLWNDPPTFVPVPPKTPARAAEYAVPRAGSDPEDAECVVMTFGPTQGGTVDENVKRWVDQFHPALPTPRRTRVDVNGMHATFVEVTGTYAGNMMPGRQGLAMPTNKPGWRLLGAILESPTGLWFFKLTGPDLTVRVGARAFEDMVRSARPR
ncbi:MAG TPA: hypothetical protein VE987_09435 [Polyangiaceae bacterium]|nr:hypothetical protein [Polyangiaceae bacterium]